MQRIPNPVSNPDIFLRTFRQMHTFLKDRGTFGLDDMTEALIAQNNVTSQGAIGAEALRRSSRPDRSRDPLYNQSKMYAELFRLLGWMHSMTKSLSFAFSELGEHLVTATNPNALMRECLLGIAIPNEIVGVQSDQNIRVIGSILLTLDLVGEITRDELMAGPMNLKDDSDQRNIESMVHLLKDFRKKPGSLNSYIDKIAASAGITRSPTMENYTRFPIAVFPWSGWATKIRPGVLAITPAGKAMARRLRTGHDIRLEQFNNIPIQFKPAFIRLTFYKMLERAGFDIEPVKIQLKHEEKLLFNNKIPCEGDIYFSPFQQLSSKTFKELCPELVEEQNQKLQKANKDLTIRPKKEDYQKNKNKKLTYALSQAEFVGLDMTDSLVREIKGSYSVNKQNENKTLEAFILKYSTANQDVFYPLVTELFCLLGFNCKMSRRGVNYTRADAIIIDSSNSIPIEIKSPGEETEISVKAIRQALENKIVLLSRKSYPTKPNTTSLVVGFNPPNNRSEVHELINDIGTVYQIRIGVIDFRSLVKLVMHTVFTENKLKLHNFFNLKGVINV